MKISGFTMGKNISKLYYPMIESIKSILPIVDEFVVALGDSDADDTTLQEIQQINSDKIKIIRTVWDLEKYPRGMENAHQTDIAKNACSGDWLFYIQADEVVHEKYLAPIYENCEKYLDNSEVEGFLFNYLHFFGDYKHYNNKYGWYPNEIRIVRNEPDIHSYISAQSFRRIPNFDGINYRQKADTFKLKVAKLDAYIYHYGWVRPPEYMQKKSKALATIHHGKAGAEKIYEKETETFDYGNLSKLKKFTETHPKVMAEWIAKFNWAEQLHYEKNYKVNREKLKHEKLRYKLKSFIEQKIFMNKIAIGYKNWEIVRQ